jgi:hypothetical protein
MTERRLSPAGWILPEVVIVRTCADCGIVTRSTAPVPVLPPAYALEWLCEECYRTWKHEQPEHGGRRRQRPPPA